MMRAGGADSRAVRGVGVALSVIALLGAGACGPGDRPESSSKSPSASGSASVAPDTSAAEAAKSVLDKGIVNMESLGEGDGAVQKQFGNTLASVPEDVLSVSFAFTCTGGAEVALTFRLTGKEVASAAGTHVCDGSTIFQRSIDTTGSGPLGFSAIATGAESGGYAYAYYSEKKQLP
ncbi:hypothetical protein [Streptomyces sp. SID2119]|uniref:hypothetical protein n=1 Tax=Streptomyces sp. SID2119 TaxID=2690253 RepID=UPI001369FA45|nr:hypothetical protein [Streptomyces sp. SID2119]MYW29239.1 hypothetical protein [Streptomyces sp. SID2119]